MRSPEDDLRRNRVTHAPLHLDVLPPVIRGRREPFSRCMHLTRCLSFSEELYSTALVVPPLRYHVPVHARSRADQRGILFCTDQACYKGLQEKKNNLAGSILPPPVISDNRDTANKLGNAI